MHTLKETENPARSEDGGEVSHPVNLKGVREYLLPNRQESKVCGLGDIRNDKKAPKIAINQGQGQQGKHSKR